jgi:hypothetical protein
VSNKTLSRRRAAKGFAFTPPGPAPEIHVHEWLDLFCEPLAEKSYSPKRIGSICTECGLMLGRTGSPVRQFGDEKRHAGMILHPKRTVNYLTIRRAAELALARIVDERRERAALDEAFDRVEDELGLSNG